MDTSADNFLLKIRHIHEALNIPDSFANDRKLPAFMEATNLVEVYSKDGDKKHKLISEAADAWAAMETAASKDKITLLMISGYRSLEYQRALIEKKLLAGQDILQILTLLAPPGYSEHHTGRAIDLTTEGCPPCVERFENTDAFSWLIKNAGDFRFSLSYPRNNPYGFIYEPWHWAYHP